MRNPSQEGYYNDTIFHRVVKGFIAQGGDPTNSGEGGESIWGKPFKDEFHSRLRFSRRGLLAMASGKANNNESQFFFTLDKAPDLEKKHTIFGKCVGETLFNMLKIADTEVDKNDRPFNIKKINSTEVILNPFPDIIPRDTKRNNSSIKEELKKLKEKPKKNFTLLSFGEEAEEDEGELNGIFNENSKGKGAHDLADDVKLSTDLAVRPEEIGKKAEEVDPEEKERVKSKILQKLSKKAKLLRETGKDIGEEGRGRVEEEEEDMYDVVLTEAEMAKKLEMDAIKGEFRRLKQDINKLDKKDKEIQNKEKEAEKAEQNLSSTRKAFRTEKKQFKAASKKTTGSKEEATLAMLEKFRSHLRSARKEKEAKETPEVTKIGGIFIYLEKLKSLF